MFRSKSTKYSNRNRRRCKKLVQHLRKNNLGRASFLPITSVRGRKLDKIKGHEKGVVGIASDIVKFNKNMNKLY